MAQSQQQEATAREGAPTAAELVGRFEGDTRLGTGGQLTLEDAAAGLRWQLYLAVAAAGGASRGSRRARDAMASLLLCARKAAVGGGGGEAGASRRAALRHASLLRLLRLLRLLGC